MSIDLAYQNLIRTAYAVSRYLVRPFSSFSGAMSSAFAIFSKVSMSGTACPESHRETDGCRTPRAFANSDCVMPMCSMRPRTAAIAVFVSSPATRKTVRQAASKRYPLQECRRRHAEASLARGAAAPPEGAGTAHNLMSVEHPGPQTGDRRGSGGAQRSPGAEGGRLGSRPRHPFFMGWELVAGADPLKPPFNNPFAST